jgi:hypothetical protein
VTRLALTLIVCILGLLTWWAMRSPELAAHRDWPNDGSWEREWDAIERRMGG